MRVGVPGALVRRCGLLLIVCALFGAPVVAYGQDDDPSTVKDPFTMRAKPRATTRVRQPRRRSRSRPASDKVDETRSVPRPNLLSGDVVVPVQEPSAAVTINLGLARGGVALIEFPANDPIYTINPADENLVTIDRPEGRPMKNTDPVTFRPGSQFAPSEGKGLAPPSAQISIQMTSGLLLVVNVHAVRDLSRSITRVTLRYDRSAIVAARRALGLGADLNGQETPPPTPPLAAEARLPAAPPTLDVPFNPGATPVSARAPRLVAPVQIASGRPLLIAGKTPDEITHDELTLAIESPSKVLSKFSSPTHGLQLATGTAREVDSAHKLLIFAIKNAAKVDIRLTPGQPDVFIETMDGENRSVNIEHLEKVRTETTALERLVPSGGIVYYAVLFKSPVLGARQRLRISVSPMTAADEPATSTVANDSTR
jgi:hypothetical protein